VDAADGAFGAWSQALPPERQRVFLAATDILERRSDEVVGLLARRPAAPSSRPAAGRADPSTDRSVR
jgi:acyl-CoA reductase-like NAD-dependent aldehyde dehydrogenase